MNFYKFWFLQGGTKKVKNTLKQTIRRAFFFSRKNESQFSTPQLREKYLKF